MMMPMGNSRILFRFVFVLCKFFILKGNKMKESIYKSYDELPLFLNSELVAQVLGVSISSAYELMHEKDFPSLRVGNRFVIPKENFIDWVEKKMKK